ncbi:MAG: aminodeoxychorismate synthase component I [Pseudomonadota bacterium]
MPFAYSSSCAVMGATGRCCNTSGPTGKEAVATAHPEDKTISRLDCDILCEAGPDGSAIAFSDADQRIIAWSADDVAGALAEIDDAHRRGSWVAGYFSYELGYVLEPKLCSRLPPDRHAPLIAVGVYASGSQDHAEALLADERSTQCNLTNPVPVWNDTAYAQVFDKVARYIEAGDIYQANLTFPLVANWSGDPFALYRTLRARQPVGYGAYVRLNEGPIILSRSPELFFSIDLQGVIETRPMKGTLPRGANDVEDRLFRDGLSKDEKNRAENLMIVDLLRNDISRVAEVGTVRVPKLFHVDTYKTVHQMVSHVQATLRKGVQPGDILRALFPCGSITGAPKIRAMEIIRELEPEARDAYCGAVGWMAPDGRMVLNVAIRTISLFEDGSARLNVGGGVVYDSTAAAEYEEALWKARFADLSSLI